MLSALEDNTQRAAWRHCRVSTGGLATPPHCFAVGVFRSLQCLYSHTLLTLSSQENQDLPRGIINTQHYAVPVAVRAQEILKIHLQHSQWLCLGPRGWLLNSGYPKHKVCLSWWCVSWEMSEPFFWVQREHFKTFFLRSLTHHHMQTLLALILTSLKKRHISGPSPDWYFAFSFYRDRVQRHTVDCQPCSMNKTAWHGGG